jgi:hypothetical protein
MLNNKSNIIFFGTYAYKSNVKLSDFLPRERLPSVREVRAAAEGQAQKFYRNLAFTGKARGVPSLVLLFMDVKDYQLNQK